MSTGASPPIDTRNPGWYESPIRGRHQQRCFRQEARTNGKRGQRWAVLALIIWIQTGISLPTVGFPSLAPFLRDELGLTRQQAGLFLPAYYLGTVLIALHAGWLADRFGVRRTLLLGQGVFMLALLALPLAARFDAILAIMTVVGLGYGIINPATTKVVTTWFPRGNRATAMGLKQTGFPMGGALGAWLLPLLALPLGWRWATALGGLPVLLSSAATLGGYRDVPPARGGTPRSGAAPPPASPLRAVLGSRDVWAVSVAALLFAFVQLSWIGFFVLYLREARGLSVLRASRLLAAGQAGGVAGRVLNGVASDRLFGGRRLPVLILAGGVTATLTLAMPWIPVEMPTWSLMPLLVVYGMAAVGWNGVHHTLVAELVGPEAAGTAGGLTLAVSALGVLLGPPLFGWFVDRTGSYTGAWLGLAGTTLGALACLGLVREGRRRG
jgi:predicted MFS family arabinose efflux permease